MILSKELCTDIARKFATRVTKQYVEKATESFNETVRDILQRNLPQEILRVNEYCPDVIIPSQKLTFISTRGAT